MTRLQLVQHLLLQARSSGFELRRWFRREAALPWPGGDAAVHWLCQGTRINLLLCSHSFAEAFFGGDGRPRQLQPATTFLRTSRDGVTREVRRPAHARSARYDRVWRYHLQHMMAAAEPLRYAQRFLIFADMVPQPIEPATPPEPAPDASYDEELLVRGGDGSN